MKYELALVPDKGTPVFYPVKDEGIFIGRSKNADITIDGTTVSRRHVRIWVEDSQLLVEDLSSRNGIIVNGERIRNASVAEGDQLSVGQNHFKVHVAGNPRPESFEVQPTPADAPQKTKFSNGLPNPKLLESKPTSVDLTSALTMLFDPDGLQKYLAREALELSGANRSYLIARSLAGTKPRVLAAEMRNGNPDGSPMNTTLIEHVIRTKTGIIEGQGNLEPQAFSTHGIPKGGALCVPLMGADGCIGVVYVDPGIQATAFTDDHLKLMKSFGRQAALLLEATARLKSVFKDAEQKGREEAMGAIGARVSEVIGRVRGASEQLTEHLQETSGESTDLGRGLRMLDRAVQRGEHLCDTMSAYSLASAERGPLNVTPLIQQIVSDLQGLAASRDVVLRTQCADRVVAYGAATAVTRMLTNLTLLAIDACDAGGTILISAANKPDGCYLEISGPGEGTPMPQTSKRGGASLTQGVEMATVCKLVTQQRGLFRCAPRADGGHTVTIVIPQQESATPNGASRE